MNLYYKELGDLPHPLTSYSRSHGLYPCVLLSSPLPRRAAYQPTHSLLRLVTAAMRPSRSLRSRTGRALCRLGLSLATYSQSPCVKASRIAGITRLNQACRSWTNPIRCRRSSTFGCGSIFRPQSGRPRWRGAVWLKAARLELASWSGSFRAFPPCSNIP